MGNRMLKLKICLCRVARNTSLRSSNMAVENPSFIDDFPIEAWRFSTTGGIQDWDASTPQTNTRRLPVGWQHIFVQKPGSGNTKREKGCRVMQGCEVNHMHDEPQATLSNIWWWINNMSFRRLSTRHGQYKQVPRIDDGLFCHPPNITSTRDM